MNLKRKKQIERKNKGISTKCKQVLRSKDSTDGITLIALVITILFSYDEKLKCSNSKGFLLATI